MLVLAIFDLTYVVRAVFDAYVWPKLIDERLLYHSCLIMYGSVFDMLPLIMILVIHYRNFKQRSKNLLQED